MNQTHKTKKIKTEKHKELHITQHPTLGNEHPKQNLGVEMELSHSP